MMMNLVAVGMVEQSVVVACDHTVLRGLLTFDFAAGID